MMQWMKAVWVMQHHTHSSSSSPSFIKFLLSNILWIFTSDLTLPHANDWRTQTVVDFYSLLRQSSRCYFYFRLSFVVVSSSFVCDRVCLRAARLTLNNCYHQKVYIYNQHIYGLIYAAAAAAATAAVAVLNCCASTYCSFYFSLSLQVNRSVGAMPLSHYSL